MCSATVTHLDNHRTGGRAIVDELRMHGLTQRYKEMVPALLDNFFTEADDFLFKLAERTTDGFEANAYFDQLRALRLLKVEIRQYITTETNRWLQSGAKPWSKTTKAEAAKDDADSLSLMDDVSLERSLATDSFAVRAADRAGDQWLAFHERLKVIVDDSNLTEKQTPFNAESFGKIVLEGLSMIDGPIKTTLMLFRLFDEMAIPKVGSFYTKANAWLIEEGILPNLKLAETHSHAQRAGNGPVTAQTIAEISASLAGMPYNQNGPNGFAGPNMAGFVGHGAGEYRGPLQGGYGSGVMIDPALLQQMMSSMAQFQTQAAPAAHNLADLKAWTTQQASAVTQQAKGTLEAGTVSLVAMLFEYILDDDSLSAHMKQLLARMQIPIIKVAILDKEFFTDTDHSARVLLNRMARSATGWRPDANIENDPLLDGMEHIVSRLNHEFDDDLGLFDELLTEFTGLLEQYESNKSSKVDQVLNVEEQAFETHIKQDRAKLFIETLLENETLPDAISSLIEKDWYRLMKAIYEQQGDSKAWKTSGRIARELVWTLQPSVQFTHPKRFEKVVPKLMEGFVDGLEAAGFSEARISNAVEEIKNHHALYAKPADEDIWEAQEKLEQFEERSAKAEEMIEELPQLPVDEPVVHIKNADLSFYLDQVESMTIDQWFDIEMKDGTIERGCLSGIIGQRSKFVFTNYKGDKIAERSAIGLAMSLLNDQFKAIDEDPFFDRMIDSLVDDLGSKQTH